MCNIFLNKACLHTDTSETQEARHFPLSTVCAYVYTVRYTDLHWSLVIGLSPYRCKSSAACYCEYGTSDYNENIFSILRDCIVLKNTYNETFFSLYCKYWRSTFIFTLITQHTTKKIRYHACWRNTVQWDVWVLYITLYNHTENHSKYTVMYTTQLVKLFILPQLPLIRKSWTVMLPSKVPPPKTPWAIHYSVKLINWKNVQNNIKLQST